ncbi:MAG: hypothetical protein ACKVOW_10950 [Chitinophagaceae bacterium]
MKVTRAMLFLFLAVSMAPFSIFAQSEVSDSTGLPGDHFSLEGALELFKKAGSIEEFEKLLNTEDNHVNNLDIDEDGDIDYIRVISKKENDAHAFILQVAVSENENQDIAVIELEKTGAETAIIQIIGDEEIFGEETIIEPGDGDEENSTEKDESAKGPYDSYSFNNNTGVIVNVWLWPSVRFVYRPAYTVWVSPWRWHRYPTWWHPWRPLRWHVYHSYRARYYRGFAVVRTHRIVHAHRIYTPFRATSVAVRNRHAVARKNYTVTRSRTTVTGPRGNSVTRKTTTVRGRGGKVKASKTTVRRKRN